MEGEICNKGEEPLDNGELGVECIVTTIQALI